MPPDPSRATTAGRVFHDLRNLATRQGRSTDELLVFYALERFLYRLHRSPHADRFILKGGLLLAVYDARRATRDADLLARNLASDEETLLAVVADIASIAVDDGIVYETARARSTRIREADQYAGVRIVVPAVLGKARTNLALDINFGDPVTPDALQVSFPQLLEDDGFTLLSYPIETILAEKLTTMIQLGDLNTRERDWADVWRLSGVHDIDGNRLYKAVATTATYRGVQLQPLSSSVQRLPQLRQQAYAGWRRRQLPDGSHYPERFPDLVADVIRFADPLITGRIDNQTWLAAFRSWGNTQAPR